MCAEGCDDSPATVSTATLGLSFPPYPFAGCGGDADTDAFDLFSCSTSTDSADGSSGSGAFSPLPPCTLPGERQLSGLLDLFGGVGDEYTLEGFDSGMTPLLPTPTVTDALARHAAASAALAAVQGLEQEHDFDRLFAARLM